MNYLSGALRYVAGTDSDEATLVPRLTDRIKTSALPHDRRDAIVQLTAAAKRSPARQAHVGEHAVKLIYAVLEQDADLDDTVNAALDLLIALCGALEPPPHLTASQPRDENATTDRDTDAPQKPVSPRRGRASALDRQRAAFLKETAAAAATNVDAFLGLPNALHLLLALLARPHFYLKFATIELLTAMSANSRDTLQAAILDAPQGVTRICDVLDDPHRHIRSNAVLLLSALVDRSPEICKIVVFAGAFENLFSFVDAVADAARPAPPDQRPRRRARAPGEAPGEAPGDSDDNDGDDDDDGGVEDAIVVQDVLVAARNLLLGAPSTRTFFRDSACVPRLVAVLHRAAADAALDGADAKPGAPAAPALRAALEAQARRNLLVAMQCVAALVAGTDDETRRVKDELATTGIFKTLVSLAFTPSLCDPEPGAHAHEPPPPPPPPAENALSVRVAALRTIAGLVRGHDDFRAAFALPVPGASVDDDDEPALAPSGPVVALRATRADPSAAVRLAAFCALRDAFVADAGLGLPASALVTSLAAGGGADASGGAFGMGHSRSLSHGSLSASAPGSPGDAAIDVADALKLALASGPAGAGPAGVFYAAAALSWVASAAPDARERLLGSHVHGVALLPQIVRALGRLERERGPPAARVALFALLCVWLHGSAAAVAAFLSSAMHLPMLVGIFQAGGARGDAAEVHVRGLAAVVLGICLQAADASSTDASADAGFLSGGGGASAAMSRATVADVIRTRVGVTVFTSALDDLRSTRAFSAGAFDREPWKLADAICPREESHGYASAAGDLGFDNWYQAALLAVVDDVYKHVSAVALGLLAETPQPALPAPANAAPEMNGHAGDATRPASGESVLADSARDEVLQSYKEFIRTQDESLNAARVQIDELSTALREAQQELDAKTAEASSARVSEAVSGLRRDNGELQQAKDTLEALLAEKNKDFAALSDAFAALEEEQMANGAGGDQDVEALADDLRKLRSERDVLQQTLDIEMRKNMDLSRARAGLNDSIRAKDAELAALSNERQALSSNVHPDVVEALQWRTRAEVAENKLQTRQASNDALETEKAELETRLGEAERRQSESAALVDSLRESVAASKAEVDSIRSSRNRELQVSRETSASSAAAQGELESLRRELAEAKAKVASLESVETTKPMPQETTETIKKLRDDNVQLRKTVDQMKAELADSRQAVSQWQKRAEAGEAAKERAELDSARLTNTTKSLESKVKSLTEELESQKQGSVVSESRVSELHTQMTELEEMRRRQEEENNELKEELSSRTEQSIKLSGQVYAMEEARAKMEAEMEQLQAAASAQNDASSVNQEQMSPVDTAEVEELQKSVAELRTELEAKVDALADSEDKLNLLSAKVGDRDDAITKVENLESEVEKWKTAAETSSNEIEALQTRMLALGQAEESKRVLTMQVVELQAQLRDREAAESSSAARSTSEDQNAQVEELQKELSEVKQVSEARLDKLTSTELALSTASTKLDETEQALENTSTELSDTKQTLATTAERLSNVENKVTEYSSKAGDLETSVKEHAETLSEAQRSLSSAKAELSEAQTALSSSTERVSALEAQNKELNEKTGDLQAQLTEARAERDVLESEIVQLKIAAEEARTTESAAAEQLAAVQATLAEAEQRRIALEEDVAAKSAATEQVAQLEKKLADAEEQRVTLEQQVAASSAVSEQHAAVEAKLADAEQRCAALEDKLAAAIGEASGAKKATEEQEADLLAQKRSLAGDLESVQARLSSVQTNADNDALAASVEHVVSSVILDAALTASVTDADARLASLHADRDAASSEAAFLKQHLSNMQAMQAELDSAKARCNEQDVELNALKSELSSLRSSLNEKADIATRLQRASESIEALTVERDALAKQLSDTRSSLEGSTIADASQSDSRSLPDSAATSSRVAELEGALRDAARTVSTTNRELIAAQGLLVELSADKTEMRAELEHAEARIAELAKAMESTTTATSSIAPRAPMPASVTGALSEVSDPDQATASDATESAPERTQLGIRNAQAEADNLRVALDRSMTEADSAATILDCIHSKMAEVENMLHASRESIQASKSSERSLEEELRTLQSSYTEEKASMLRNEESLNAKIVHIEQARDEEKARFEADLRQTSEKASQEAAALRDEILRQETMVEEVRGTAKSLREELAETSTELEGAKGSIATLEASEQSLDARLRVTQQEVEATSAKLSATEAREQELRQTLAETELKFDETVAAHDRDRKKKQEHWENESREYEEEIDRCTKALEDAEATFRDTERALQSDITRIESDKAAVTAELNACKASLQSCESKLATALRERDRVEAELSSSLRDKTRLYDEAEARRNALQTELSDVTDDRDDLRVRLTDSDRSLMGVRDALKEETELKLILESENQDFATALEELEQRCKRISDELRSMTSEYESSDKERRRLERSVEDERKVVLQLKKKVHRVEEELGETRLGKTDAEKTVDNLRSKLASSEQTCANWARDNEDLRAWVGDLERQASEMQNAASDFEEVEQTLRDTLESQRQTAEQNAKLSDEVRREREALWAAQARARKAERERDTSKTALGSSEQRVSEMERRLKEIRESHASKLSVSESGLRAKAQQCAELESQLLDTERRNAELERASDEAFSARAEARRAEDEMGRLRERCDGAEGQVETLEVELQKAREEVECVRDGASGEAMRALEAEHNELLVYLADLELELTTLKDKDCSERE